MREDGADHQRVESRHPERDGVYDDEGGFHPSPCSKAPFVLRITCANCNETVVMAGMLLIEEHEQADEYSDDVHTWAQQDLVPHCIESAPKLFEPAEGTPKKVRDAIESSFRFYWLDRDACVSRLRLAVELFLDSEGVEDKTASGAPIPLG